MTNIKEKLSQDIKEAMKSKDVVKLETVRSISNALTNFEKQNPGAELNLPKIFKQLENQRKQSIEAYTTGGNTEAALKEEKELFIVQLYMGQFLPSQISDDEIRQYAKELHETLFSNETTPGKFMGAFKKKYGNTVDMKKANEAVMEILKQTPIIK
jgi:uncharacterized protein YqeY